MSVASLVYFYLFFLSFSLRLAVLAFLSYCMMLIRFCRSAFRILAFNCRYLKMKAKYILKAATEDTSIFYRLRYSLSHLA